MKVVVWPQSQGFLVLLELVHEGDEDGVGGLGALLLRDPQPLLHRVEPTVVGDEGLVLLQLVGALQVWQQPLGGLRVAPHRGGRCRSGAAGTDAAASIAGGGGPGGGAGRRELGIGRAADWFLV